MVLRYLILFIPPRTVSSQRRVCVFHLWVIHSMKKRPACERWLINVGEYVWRLFTYRVADGVLTSSMAEMNIDVKALISERPVPTEYHWSKCLRLEALVLDVRLDFVSFRLGNVWICRRYLMDGTQIETQNSCVLYTGHPYNLKELWSHKTLSISLYFYYKPPLTHGIFSSRVRCQQTEKFWILEDSELGIFR